MSSMYLLWKTWFLLNCLATRGQCITVNEAIPNVELRLSIYTFFSLIICSYGHALIQLNPKSWSQMFKLWMLWLELALGENMPFFIFYSIYIPKACGDGGKNLNERYYLTSWGPMLASTWLLNGGGTLIWFPCLWPWIS